MMCPRRTLILESKTRLLEPELLQSHLAAAFDLFLKFAGLFGLHLHRRLRAAVLELNLRIEGPAFAEIVAHHEDGVRKVHAAVPFGIGVLLRVGVAEHVVAIKVVLVNGLAISADGEAAFRLHAVGHGRIVGGGTDGELRC